VFYVIIRAGSSSVSQRKTDADLMIPYEVNDPQPCRICQSPEEQPAIEGFSFRRLLPDRLRINRGVL